ncbi:MAG: DGQHR domain-containing protein [Planctomycetales bacterium]|jgi:DGQHR domain-containing protein
MPRLPAERESFGSVSLVRQGDHRFFNLTMPSDILAQCCFVINRDENPQDGFQRVLNKKRAAEIAAYIDDGMGTIPSSIVLSAQGCAKLEYNSKKKSLAFDRCDKAFLILDGQHRVFGFSMAKTSLRVPVVIYPNLTRRDETRLFIDINSKQKGVPPELLLDIKQLAEYENDNEQLLRDVFDLFHSESDSILLGRLSPASKVKGKLSRSVFNSSFKSLIVVIGDRPADELYEILNAYFIGFSEAVLAPMALKDRLFVPTVFRAITAFFPRAAARLKDRYGADYSVDNFHAVLQAVGMTVRKSQIQSPGQAYKPLVKHFEDALASDFEL